MSICIVGQKFNGNDIELSKFIREDLQDYINSYYREHFLNKETAVEIANKVRIHSSKEREDLSNLIKISESKDINLLQQQEVIIKKNSIENCRKRIKLLEKVEESKNYNEILSNLIKYYNSREYTTLSDIKLLSSHQKILIFHNKGTYYTSLLMDNEKEAINFLLNSGKFTDYSFDFNHTEDKKLSDKELVELLEKEEVWKTIYSSLYKDEVDKEKKEIAASYYFNIVSLENINYYKEHKNFKDLHEIIISILKGDNKDELLKQAI